MSFSSDIKDEILKNLFTNKKECCIKAEKFGEYLIDSHTLTMLNEEFKEYLDISKLNECCIKAILKGAFLGSGCIIDPNSNYHFEITTKSKTCAEYILNLLSVLDFKPRIIKKKKINVYTVYFKESDQISLFLSIVGANASLLKFEEIRVEKEVKNKINRNINCETANLSKTITSSYKQIQAIKKIKASGKFKDLDDRLKYVSLLREKYKEESLEYIASKTSGQNKLSKSGLKHRLDKIINFANELYK